MTSQLHVFYFPECWPGVSETARVFLKPGKACSFLLKEMAEAHAGFTETDEIKRCLEEKNVADMVRIYGDFFGKSTIEYFPISLNNK